MAGFKSGNVLTLGACIAAIIGCITGCMVHWKDAERPGSAGGLCKLVPSSAEQDALAATHHCMFTL